MTICTHINDNDHNDDTMVKQVIVIIMVIPIVIMMDDYHGADHNYGNESRSQQNW